jgi:hypothetical protein
VPVAAGPIAGASQGWPEGPSFGAGATARREIKNRKSKKMLSEKHCLKPIGNTEDETMAYKPGDFFIGVIDFFGILVPGAILFSLHGKPLVELLGLPFPQDQAGLWAAFAVGSYVVGNFLFCIGAPLNRLLQLYHREDKDSFYSEVKSVIGLPVRKNRTDAFYRAYSLVRIKSSSAAAEIERQMADFKLFRSLTLVFALDFLLELFLGGSHWPRLAFSGILFVLAAWRFLFLLDWTYRITFEYFALLSKEELHARSPQGRGRGRLTTQRPTGCFFCHSRN